MGLKVEKRGPQGISREYLSPSLMCCCGQQQERGPWACLAPTPQFRNWAGGGGHKEGYIQGSRGTGGPEPQDGSKLTQRIQNPPAKQTQVPSLCWEDSPGEGNGNPLQYYCQENPMDTGAW